MLARLREREPVSWVPALGGWLVTRRDLALQVMRDAETFTVDDPRFSTGAGRRPEHAHARRRRSTAATAAPFARPFRLDAVRERFTPPVEAETDRLLDAIAPAGAAELRRELAGPLAVAAVTLALGLEATGRDEVLGWYDAIVASVTAITAGGAADGGRPARVRGAARGDGAGDRAAPETLARGRGRRRRGRAVTTTRSSPTPPCCCSAASRRPRA